MKALWSIVLSVGFASVPLHGMQSNGISPLMQAAQDGDVETVQQLLDSKVSITAQTHCNQLNGLLFGEGYVDDDKKCHGYTALYYAAKNGHLPVVKALLQAESERACIIPKKRALIDALCNKHEDVVCEMLDYASKTDYENCTLLKVAVMGEHIKVLKKLISLNVPLDTKEVPLGNTLLHFTVILKNQTMCKMLVDAGADLSIKNDLNQTPAQLAHAQNNQDFVAILSKK